ncbi:Aldehyde reductase Ahr [Pseudobythopirellula maris]|uniref:alcohol dehydrogenase (NADP(+)) n=1 Tax=Pseudobythopirellula maris TaxID=2527991 RepID=A0A5C5ZNS4_9BACT|nr:NAD(P)-dependent alcohol dehydrogenase [Pseudobythopirellula maris]TWT88083.1 Aldehyde reductase Ahr [Pseudobythopirellula maris]
MPTFHALAAHEAGGELKPFEYDPGDLGPDEVEIAVKYCGLCHSDLSMLGNDWGISVYPYVPGHEVAGVVAAKGDRVTGLEVGQSVGLGWYSSSCMFCDQCMSGDHNLCGSAGMTIVGRHGGFADRVRASQEWVIPIPDSLDPSVVGPMFCGGATVFNPFLQSGVRPIDRIGVVGIGGLGHMALKIGNAWGCEVTAFSGSPDKEDEAREMGADHFVNSRDPQSLESVAGSFDLILDTVGAELPWEAYINALSPRGKLHIVGAAPSVSTPVMPLIMAQRTITATPVGSPQTLREMVRFATRHDIAPIVEPMKLSEANDAMERLRSGSPRYRIVLENDLG